LTFVDEADCDCILEGDLLALPDISQAIRSGRQVELVNQTKGETYAVEHTLSERQVEIVLVGGQINLFRKGR
jgi:aconitate hydratase